MLVLNGYDPYAYGPEGNEDGSVPFASASSSVGDASWSYTFRGSKSSYDTVLRRVNIILAEILERNPTSIFVKVVR